MTNYDEEIEKASADMHSSEDALAELGFPTAQWMLVKKYVLAAILHNQLTALKTMESIASGQPPTS